MEITILYNKNGGVIQIWAGDYRDHLKGNLCIKVTVPVGYSVSRVDLSTGTPLPVFVDSTEIAELKNKLAEAEEANTELETVVYDLVTLIYTNEEV